MTTHGMKGTRAYSIWCGMRGRCKSKSARNAKYYADRGIVVCERWNSFANFLADMGHPPDGCSIDRINPDGNYEPSNCRWATASQQSKNRRRTVRVLKRKLTSENAGALREDRANGMTWQELSGKYRVSIGACRAIVCGRTYVDA